MSTQDGLMVVQAIKDGTVVDHIPAKEVLRVVEILAQFEDFVAIGINFPSQTLVRKGVVKISNRFLSEREVDTIALVAPGATVNIIRDFKVVEKHKVHMPGEIDRLIVCNNPKCITNVDVVATKFHVEKKDPLVVTCLYCERPMEAREIRVHSAAVGG